MEDDASFFMNACFKGNVPVYVDLVVTGFLNLNGTLWFEDYQATEPEASVFEPYSNCTCPQGIKRRSTQKPKPALSNILKYIFH